MEKKFVFISYSREDLSRVEPIVNKLESMNIGCIFDKTSILVSEDFLKKLATGIDECKVVVFFVSRSSVNSYWTASEFLYARDKNKIIICYDLDKITAEVMSPDNARLIFCLNNIKERSSEVISLVEKLHKYDETIPGKNCSIIRISAESPCCVYIDNVYRCDCYSENIYLELPFGKYHLKFIEKESGNTNVSIIELNESKIVDLHIDFPDISELQIKERALQNLSDFKIRKIHQYYAVSNGEYYALINIDGLYLTDFIFKEVEEFGYNMKVLSINDKWGLYDVNTRIYQLSCRYDHIMPIVNGMARVCMNGFWGFIDAEGNEIISCIYEKAEDFNEDGFACVSKEYKGLLKIDKKGIVVEMKSDKGQIQVSLSEDGSHTRIQPLFDTNIKSINHKYVILDKDGNLMYPYSLNDVETRLSRYYYLKSGDNYGILDPLTGFIVDIVYKKIIFLSIRIALLIDSDEKAAIIDLTDESIIVSDIVRWQLSCLPYMVYWGKDGVARIISSKGDFHQEILGFTSISKVKKGCYKIAKEGSYAILKDGVLSDFKYNDENPSEEYLNHVETYFDKDMDFSKSKADDVQVKSKKGHTSEIQKKRTEIRLTTFKDLKFVVNNVNLSKGFVAFKEDQRYGIKNKKGEIVLTASYSSIDPLSDFCAVVTKDGNHQLFFYDEGILRSGIYHDVKKTGALIVAKSSGISIFDQEGNLLFDDVDLFYKVVDKTYAVHSITNNKIALINSVTYERTEYEYTSVGKTNQRISRHNYVIKVVRDGKVYELASSNLKEPISRESQSKDLHDVMVSENDRAFCDMNHPYRIVRKEGKIGLYSDEMGCDILSCIYDEISSDYPSAKQNIYLVKKDGHFGMIDLWGDMIVDCIFDHIQNVEGISPKIFLVELNGRKGVIDSLCNQVLNCEYDEISINEQNLLLKKDGLYGISKMRGLRTEICYRNITRLNNSLFCGETGNHVDIIDSKNLIVLMRAEDYIVYPSMKVSAVKSDGKWGFISNSGEKVTDFIYDSVAKEYDGGILSVILNGKEIKLNRKAEVWKENKRKESVRETGNRYSIDDEKFEPSFERMTSKRRPRK